MTKILTYAWWCAIIWSFSTAFSRPYDDWKNMLLYVGGGVLILLDAKMRQIFQEGRSQAIHVLILSIYAYFLVCIVSILRAPTGWYEGVLELARLGLWVFLACHLIFTFVSKITIIKLTVISAAIITINTVLTMNGHGILSTLGPFNSPIGHFSYYGDFFALCWPMGAYLVAISRSWRPRILWASCTVLISGGLFLSAARTSFVGLFVALLCAILIMAMSRQWKKSAIAMGVVIATATMLLAMPVGSLRGETLGRRVYNTVKPIVKSRSFKTLDEVSSGRWHGYETSVRMALNRPILGWGIGTYRFVYPEFAYKNGDDALASRKTWYYHPHNEILHQFVEVGIVGTALWLLGFFALIIAGIKRFIIKPDNLLLLGLTGLITAFVSWQFSTSYLFPVSRLITALYAAIVFIKALDLEFSNSDTRARTTSYVITACLIILTTYYISLYNLNKALTSTGLYNKWHAIAKAADYAPFAFDAMLLKSSFSMKNFTPQEAAEHIESAYRNYKFIPPVLYQMGVLNIAFKKPVEAKAFFHRALDNDPTFNDATTAIEFLKQPLDR